MTSAFSSSESAILERENNIKADCQIATPTDEINDVYEVERCIDFIQKNDCQVMALQFPDELLIDAANVTRALHVKSNAKIFVLADTSYGSYDVDEVAAQHVQADLIIHYGRSALTASSTTKTIFVFGRSNINIEETCNAFCLSFPENNANVVLMLELPWIYATEPLKESLQSTYTNLIVAQVYTPQLTVSPVKEDSCPKACPDCSCRTDQQARKDPVIFDTTPDDLYRIGCYKIDIPPGKRFEDYSLFFIGTSQSETLRNILLHQPACQGHVFDPVARKCSKISMPINKIIRKRYYIVEKLKDAKSIGILVGTMGMAGYREIIDHLKKIASACGKKAYIFIVGKLNPNKLANFPEIDAFVLVACPEETLIDQTEYYKPISTPYELEMACNANREWGNIFPLDFRQLLPGGKHYIDFKARSGEGDVSLLTGSIRHFEKEEASAVGREIETRNMETTLAAFHPHSAARFYAERSWRGLEQKLGETPVEMAKEGRSGRPVAYTHGKS